MMIVFPLDLIGEIDHRVLLRLRGASLGEEELVDRQAIEARRSEWESDLVDALPAPESKALRHEVR